MAKVTVDLSEYRSSPNEIERTKDLMRLVPNSGRIALDVGARDGHFSTLLTEHFARVVALDLTLPTIKHPQIECVAGNAADLKFADNSIDFVLCAQVLEHVPATILPQVCNELARVCSRNLLVGVPNRQDIRAGRTTCLSCGQKNPAWGHVNRFDEEILSRLFPEFTVETVSFVGTTNEQTNALSVFLMDLAGNPYGTYHQEEPCVHCGQRLIAPQARNLAQKVATKLSFMALDVSRLFANPRGNWLHVLMAKCAGQAESLVPHSLPVLKATN